MYGAQSRPYNAAHRTYTATNVTDFMQVVRNRLHKSVVFRHRLYSSSFTGLMEVSHQVGSSMLPSLSCINPVVFISCIDQVF